jgi:DNA invertase Pin-like site-specific DNA recombinase
MKAPELYEDEVKRYCNYKGLELAEIFSDIDYSGYNRSEDRPALNELVGRRKEFAAVVIPKLSRFGRSLKHLTQLFETFDSDGIALVFLDLGMDTSTSQGRLLRNIMAAFAEYESAVRGDYTRANMRLAARSGLPFGGRPPLGYARANKTYEVDPRTGPIVSRIFTLYEAGATQTSIAKELRLGDPVVARMSCWTPNRIGRILDNPCYAALMPIDGELIEGGWPPIVDPDVWFRIVKRRKATRQKWSRPRAEKRLLAGLIYCGDCGRKAYFSPRGTGPPRYRCGHNHPESPCSSSGMSADPAEAFVVQAFFRRVNLLVMQAPSGPFFAEEKWDVSTLAERRMILGAAISSITMVRREEELVDRHESKRRLLIVWKEHLDPIEPTPKRGVPASGRAVTLIKDQRRDFERDRGERSRKAKAYFTEWAEARDRVARASRLKGG